MTTTAQAPTVAPSTLSIGRTNAMRAGYLLMAVGLAIVKWPLLPDAHTMTLYEGVTVCLLTGMSILAFVGLRHPTRMLPVLVFESLWKALWLSLVALPRAAAGDVDPPMREVIVNCSLIVVIIAVVPWRHVWRTWVRGRGEPWR
jgi:hypothetical protein